MDLTDIKKIYGIQSDFYDKLFKHIFYPRQKYAINSLDIKPGDRVLDLGVGTGLSLDLYPAHCKVVGVDISPKMLAKARKKINKCGYKNVTLVEMDASKLGFMDDSFDHVIATFVISVVPHPEQVIAEMKRVCTKEGNIVLVNHFQSRNKIIAKLEEITNPFFKKLGWRTDLNLDRLAQTSNLDVRNRRQIKKIDFWQVVEAANNK